MPQERFLEAPDGQAAYWLCSYEDAGNGDEAGYLDQSSLPAHYATLTRKDDQWTLEDVSTRFGLWQGETRCAAPATLPDGTCLDLSGTRFRLEADGLHWDHRLYTDQRLSVRIRERAVKHFFKKHVIIRDVDLDIFPGEMVLILGGSGAGKTTFLNAVTGYEKADATIMLGSANVYEEYNSLKYHIAFAPQADLLREDDIVYDTLDNAAEMRLPSSCSAAERRKKVEAVMDKLSLSELRDEQVVKLSGGQRKRLSIAVEYVSDPTVFFLDEPDSGLDGVMARDLMENLRHLTDEKHMTILISHSPDRVIHLFDRVIVLAKSEKDYVGHLAFSGSPREARSFFGCETMEDILRIIDRTDEGGAGRADEFIERFQKLQKGDGHD